VAGLKAAATVVGPEMKTRAGSGREMGRRMDIFLWE
jgi:hypothetical protein